MKSKNKRGNIPITILVIGVVAICILALGSFAFSIFKSNQGFGLGVFEDIYSDVEKFYFYTGQGISWDMAAENIDASSDKGMLIIERNETNINIKYIHKIK